MFSQSRKEGKAAFTLIELLIVIAILALIAIPNFLESQIRAKVARAKADMRMITTAIEAYQTDYSQYPLSPDEYTDMETYGNGWPTATHANQYCLSHITTPIAYMTSIPPEQFGMLGFDLKDTAANPDGANQTYIYDALRISPLPFGVNLLASTHRKAISYSLGYKFLLSTCGPARSKQRPEDASSGVAPWLIISGKQGLYVYDPSNGTMSFGFILRSNKGQYTGEDFTVR